MIKLNCWAAFWDRFFSCFFKAGFWLRFTAAEGLLQKRNNPWPTPCFKAARGYFCELLISNIIGYLAFSDWTKPSIYIISDFPVQTHMSRSCGEVKIRPAIPDEGTLFSCRSYLHQLFFLPIIYHLQGENSINIFYKKEQQIWYTMGKFLPEHSGVLTVKSTVWYTQKSEWFFRSFFFLQARENFMSVQHINRSCTGQKSIELSHRFFFHVLL